MQYQTVSGVDEDEAEDGVNDSTVAYHRETKVKKPAVSIDMARRDKLFDEDEEDAFGDVIVDDEDMEGFYDNDDDDDIDLKGDELGV